MTIERAHAHSVQKPWGVVDPRPWSNAVDDAANIGEIWYERADSMANAPSLLLKLLFTSEPLSIQVHPDDAYARSIGLPNGKTEAWYVLGAAPGAKIALGLKRCLTSQELRLAIDDGTISGLVMWQSASPGDTVFVPAGTIHAIGAGLVIAEIQQRSDTTYRLFDHGRGRQLHVENAIAVAKAGPSDLRIVPTKLSDTRTLLTSNAYFALERVDLAPGSAWSLEARQETWLLVIAGGARAGRFDMAVGDALFAQSDCVEVDAGPAGMSALVAHTGGERALLLEHIESTSATNAERTSAMQGPVAPVPARAAPTSRPLGVTI